jgi:DNA-binding response OmpR family regulator
MKVIAFIPRCEVQRRVQKSLASYHFEVDSVSSIKECLQIARFVQYGGIVIDSDPLMFQDVVVAMKLLRQERSDIALFVLSRCFDLEQRVQLFEAGMDYCVSEPFFAAELSVRLGLSIRLRTAASAVGGAIDVLRTSDLELDLVRRRATRMGRLITLRPKEFSLLEYLMRNVNRPVGRETLLQHVWESSFPGLTNVVDVYVSSLRGKIDSGFDQKLIQTIRGVGYTFTCSDSQTAPTTQEELVCEEALPVRRRTPERPDWRLHSGCSNPKQC